MTTNELPVRPAFLQAAENYKSDPDKPQVQIKVSGKQELEILHDVLSAQGSAQKLGKETETKSQQLEYIMKPKDEPYFLMLGSQPTKQAIKDYVDQFLQLAKENPTKNYHLFAFTGKFEVDKECFYKELAEYIKERSTESKAKGEEWPPNLRVVPLSFQDPAQLVSLELQCHTITRSGGASIMELLVLEEVRKKLELPPKQRFVHAQKIGERSLEDSIPLWEKGNYYYLKESLKETTKVAVVQPSSLSEVLQAASTA